MATLSGKTRIEFNRHLGDTWRDLAEYFEIPARTQKQFTPGEEGYGILHWLIHRKKTEELDEALAFLNREDLQALLVTPERPATPDRQTEWPADRSPYPGLNYFTENDAEIFFGRDAEIEKLLDKLAEPERHFLAVVGASGSGKSSLVAAGVIPELSKTDWARDWVVLRFTPGELGTDTDPFTPLLAQLKPLLEENNLDTREEGDALRARGDLGGLVQKALASKSNAAELLLFIDQFEELFTVVAPQWQPRFAVMLARAARADRIRIIVTLRADFIPNCLEHEALKKLLNNDGQYLLTAPDPRAQMAMITGPAVVAGLQLEDDLALRILYDTGREPGALALMAYTLALLWERRQAGKLTHAAYDEFGGVRGAIQEKAKQTYKKLEEQLGRQAAADALGDVFVKLVEVDPERNVPTRKRAAQKHFADSPAASNLIDAFSDRKARLLICDKGVVEVAHEALLRHWPRLNEWIQKRFDDFRLLRQVKLEAGEWRKHRAFLWPHERLMLVYRMCANLGLDANPERELTTVERAFIRPESDRLLKRIRNPAMHHKDRAKIGDRLAEIGDPRPGVGLRRSLPDIDWCEVPGGKVKLENNAGTFQVKPFHIARYPVTYIQYRCFLKAEDGYRNRRWWEEQGLAERQDKPGEQYRDQDNHPAENVSWYDAMAFCRWLNAKLADEISERFGKNRVIRLPTEWEWQQAATGGQSKYEYPWGPDWDSSRANTVESGLSRTIAVGMYLEGASPVGALDMSGNVLEWCLNEYDKPKNINLSSSARRVVRGGSWYYGSDYARAAYRYYYFAPDYRVVNQGFRVVCSSPIS